MAHDGGLQNQLAIGKDIKVIENGIVEEKSSKTDDRYFVISKSYDVENLFDVIGDYITINTASLKYGEDELNDKIKEEFYSD